MREAISMINKEKYRKIEARSCGCTSALKRNRIREIFIGEREKERE